MSRIVWLLALVMLSACSDPGGSNNASADAGVDAAETLTVELGKRGEGGVHVPLADSGESFEMISGFQGGYHIEPTLRISDPGLDEFITVVSYELVDASTGQGIAQEPARYRGNQHSWDQTPAGAWERTYQQLILDTFDPAVAEEYVGESYELRVSVEVEETGAVGSDSVTFELVNEVEELQ